MWVARERERETDALVCARELASYLHILFHQVLDESFYRGTIIFEYGSVTQLVFICIIKFIFLKRGNGEGRGVKF
jgi:hypothetical protein